MDLIIKPTQACNFKCSFCSSNNISTNQNTLSLEKLFVYITKNKVNRIIVNGGDPLMMPPKYYESILNFIEKNNLDISLSLTTNLWDFFISPNKWTKLFKRKNIYITTSFQYGGERRLYDNTPFTEDKFKEVMYKFNDCIGYMPMFISVITNNNENMVLDTVLLAKELHTTCKINPALKSGRSTYFYPIYKAIEKYIDIIKNGLEEYEYNSSELKRIMRGQQTTCPINRNCYKTIRCMGPNGEIYTCGAIHDNSIYNKSNNIKTYDLSCYDESEIHKDFPYLKKECLGCDYFMLCNGCYKQISDMISDNFVEEQCSGMKTISHELDKLK